MLKTNSVQIPIYIQMVDLLQNAFELFDDESKDEVFRFISSQQNNDGGFADRGGRSDLYYSLFGMLLVLAVQKHKSQLLNVEKNDEQIDLLRDYISTQSKLKVDGFIEICCLVLIQKAIGSKNASRIGSVFCLLKAFISERKSINLSYRSFVFFLTLESILPFKFIIKKGAEKMDSLTQVDENSPCSEVAAKVFLRKMISVGSHKENALLQSFCCESGGFKAFRHSNKADMLSTAVALFALKYSGSDFRILTPPCLDFLQDNFSEGAFLSGDGDPTKDIEYTFYGLLAMGILATNNKNN